MKRKIVMTVLGLVMIASICACGKNESADVNVVDTEVVAKVEVINTEANTELEVVDTEVVETEVTTESTESTESSEVAVEEEKEEFIVIAMEAVKYAKSYVNVRKGPSADYEKVGALSTNQEVEVIGQAETGWYKIRMGDEVAYVSNNYLVDSKVVVAKEETKSEAPKKEETPSVEEVSGGSVGEYEENERPVVPAPPVVDEEVASGNESSNDNSDLSDWNDFTGGGSFDAWVEDNEFGGGIELVPTH